nr:unnamed protein product [Digitaria exilis]
MCATGRDPPGDRRISCQDPDPHGTRLGSANTHQAEDGGRSNRARSTRDGVTARNPNPLAEDGTYVQMAAPPGGAAPDIFLVPSQG